MRLERASELNPEQAAAATFGNGCTDNGKRCAPAIPACAAVTSDAQKRTSAARAACGKAAAAPFIAAQEREECAKIAINMIVAAFDDFDDLVLSLVERRFDEPDDTAPATAAKAAS